MSGGPPPYTITPDILTRVAQIAEAVGRAEAAGLSRDLRLRRINRIRTIRGSLAIEGNILSEEQISTILDGKPVAAPLRRPGTPSRPTIVDTNSGTRPAKPTSSAPTRS